MQSQISDALRRKNEMMFEEEKVSHSSTNEGS